MVVEGDPTTAEGRRVDSRPASGGRSFTTIDSTGAFTAELSGPLARGRQGEEHALKILIQALRRRGDEVMLVTGANDSQGEDALLSINRKRVPVQIISIPADATVWKELSSGQPTLRSGNIEEAIRLVREALLHKRDKAKGTLLVLDAAHIGAIVGRRLTEGYRAKHGDPEKEFPLVEVWIVGPTIRSSIRL